MNTITCSPIGTVRCAVTEMSQGGWARLDSEIHLDERYARGLQGLEGFSHAIIVFFLDRAQGFDPSQQLLRRPRGMEDMHEVGVFAQRTKFRPNPIGVTAVRLLGVSGHVVSVRGSRRARTARPCSTSSPTCRRSTGSRKFACPPGSPM